MRTNCKEVQDKIKEHILEYYTVEELRDNADALKYGGVCTYYHAIKNMAQNGDFLIYYTEVSDFLNGLGINPTGKEYDNEKSWELYKHLVALNGKKLLK